MAKIKNIISRQILNSKGEPTIETTVILEDGTYGTASVPTGASKGSFEAKELRDNNSNVYQGLGVLNAISNIQTEVLPAITGMEAEHQQDIDRKMIELDGTADKSRLGANAILSVSMAVSKAAAKSFSLPLFLHLKQFIRSSEANIKIPTPLFNEINGGMHSQSGSMDFQEFLVIPASSMSFSQGLEMSTKIYSSLKKLLLNNNLSTLIADEGGFSPKLGSNQDALALLKQAVEAISLRLGFDVFFGMDIAANKIFADGKYHIKDKSGDLSSDNLIDFYETLNNDYHFLYLEDGLNENDWEGWSKLCTRLSEQTLIVGDDLTVTNPQRLQAAISKKAITGIIVKPNQIGTVIESLAVIQMAKQAGIKVTVSHRSGETNDDFIADFAVAASADYCKFGAPQRGERIAKYNRLLQIEQQIKSL